MKLHRVKHTIKRLSPEERVAGAGALLVLLGSFFPWYSVVFNYDKDPIIENGFTGDLGVIGFVAFLLALFALINLASENLHIKLPSFGYTKEQIMMFFMGESAFLILLLIAVYTKRSFDFTNASLRFGIWMALIGALVGTFAAYAQVQKKNQKNVEAFFDHAEEEEATEEAEDDDGEMSFRQKMEMEAQKNQEEEIEAAAEQTELADFVDNDEDEAEIMVEETEVTLEVEEEPLEADSSQSDFFKKEAGVSQEEETMEEADEEENNKTKDKGIDAISMDFYDDEEE